MTEEDLKAKILELEAEIKAKDREIYDSYDRIDLLEENIMKLELCLDEEGTKVSKKKKKSVVETKLEIELDEKEREIRDLKDRMGSLRKEKTQMQRELEKYTKVDTGTVIRIEEKKEPFETLVKELQDKINKQNRLINDLKNQLSIKDAQEETGNNLLILIQTKEKVIENLENKLIKRKDQLKNIKEVLDFKNKIIGELINQIQSHKSLWSDSQLQSKLKMLEELNEKMSKHLD